jgi:hypothetical protein
MEINEPGAITGVLLAAFTTPLELIIGVGTLAVTTPGKTPLPKRPVAETPCKVIIALVDAFDGTHVAAHCPAPRAFSSTSESPLEKEATTVPLLRLLPQLSKIVT